MTRPTTPPRAQILAICSFLCLAALASLPLQARALVIDSRVPLIMGQMKKYKNAVHAFYEQYHALPGDMKDASHLLVACHDNRNCDPAPQSADDGIIGEPHFSSQWVNEVSEKIAAPAQNAQDETTLFWAQLRLASLIDDVTTDGIKNATPVDWGTTHPRAKSSRINDAGFIVAYGDGSPVPGQTQGRGPKGNILLFVSTNVLHGKSKMDQPGQQPLAPAIAEKIERSFDNGLPFSGELRVYGAPGCFCQPEDNTLLKRILRGGGECTAGSLNTSNNARDCGLILLLPTPE